MAFETVNVDFKFNLMEVPKGVKTETTKKHT